MKHNSLLLLFITLLMISSCSNDDDNNSPQLDNFLKIGDTEYELKTGILENYGEYEPGLFNFDVTLITSSVVIIDGEPTPEDQIINGIFFELFTNNQNDLSLGTYNFVSSENIDNQTFEYAEIFQNIDVSLDDDSGTYSELIQGSFEVLSNGTEYELEFSGVNESGQSISGYYKGSLGSFDIDD